MPLVIVTGSLTPYTTRVYDRFAELRARDLHVYSCAAIEPHRHWQIAPPRHFRHVVLAGLRWHRDYVSHVYFNPGIVPELARLRPKAIALAAFSPTMALAALQARAMGIPYGLSTDGTLATDPGEGSRVHGWMRRAMVPGARFGICASAASVALLEHWGLARGRGVVVPLIPSWDPPARVNSFGERPFDLLYAGGLDDRYKGVLFFAEVIEAMAGAGARPRVRVAGAGPKQEALRRRLGGLGLDIQFDGGVQPSHMPEVLGSAKLLLFPSRQDAWGLIANEAVMCGTPVLSSPHATASEHFVARFGLGMVRPLDIDAWRDTALAMIADERTWRSMMARRDEALSWSSLETAVDGMAKAFDLAR